LLDEIYSGARDGSGDAESNRHRPLTLADYRRVGGLSGSLLRRAEALWEALEPEVRDALPVLCRGLIALEGGGTSVLGARRGDLRTLTRQPAVARLVESLIEARLLVAEGVADPSVGSAARKRRRASWMICGAS
jgi:hypothetical protein